MVARLRRLALTIIFCLALPSQATMDSAQLTIQADTSNAVALPHDSNTSVINANSPSQTLKWGQESRAIPVPLNEPRHAHQAIAFSPSASPPIFAFGHKSSLQLFDQSWTSLVNLTGLAGTIDGLAFSPNGEWLVATVSTEPRGAMMTQRSFIRIWRVSELLADGTAKTEGDSVSDASNFVPIQNVQETMLRAGVEQLSKGAGWSTAEVDKAIPRLRQALEEALEDISRDRDLDLKIGIEGGFYGFSQDSSRLYLSAGRSVISIVDLQTRETLHQITHPVNEAKAHRQSGFSWSNPRYNEEGGLHRNDAHVAWVGPSPVGKTLATVSWDSTAVLWDEETGEKLFTFDSETTNQCWVGQFANDGSWFAMGDGGGNVHVWSTADGRKLATIETGDGWLRSFALSPSGARLAVGSDRGHVRVYDVGTWEEIFAYCQKRATASADWSPREVRHLQYVDEHRLVFSVDAGSIHVLNESGEEEIRILPEDGKEYFGADSVIVKDGREIWSLDADGNIRVWQV